MTPLFRATNVQACCFTGCARHTGSRFVPVAVSGPVYGWAKEWTEPPLKVSQ